MRSVPADLSENNDASMCALCLNLQTALSLSPRFIQRLAGGDHALEMDLFATCQAKQEKWHPRDNACCWAYNYSRKLS